MTIFLILVAVLVVLLIVPVELQFDGRWPSSKPNVVKVVWCFGLVSVAVPLSTRRANKQADSENPRKVTGRDKDPFPVGRLLAQRQFRVRVYRFFSSIWRAVEKRDVRIRLRLGAADPADTGHLWAILGPLSGWLHSLKNCSIALVPDFDHAVVEGVASGRLGFSPARILAPAIAFLCSPVLWCSVSRAKAKS